MRRTAAFVAALLVTLLGPACGGEAGDVAAETGERLASVDSGDIELALAVEPLGGDGSGALGFELDGRFAVPEDAGASPFPIAEVDYTQIAGAESATLGLLSTGAAVFVVQEGQAYELPEDRAEPLRIVAGDGDGRAGLGAVDLESWVADGDVEPAGEIDGVEVDRLDGTLDVAAVTSDLSRAIQAAGVGDSAGLELGEEDAAALEGAARTASVDLVTTADERLLRDLSLTLELDLDEVSPAAAEGLEAVRVTFELSLRDVGAPVEVEDPSDPLPFESLAGSG